MNRIKFRMTPVTGQLLSYGFLFAVAYALYFKSIWFEFIPSWDDAAYVLDNLLIRGLSADHLRLIFTTPVLSNLAPLPILSYAADYAFWGLDPKGYHHASVILHSLNVCAVYAVVRRITNQGTVAFWTSLLFAVHPLNVENVAWVAERKTVLATLLFFLTMIQYLRFRESGSPRTYISAVLFFMAAVLSKASVVVLPAILAAHEFIFRKGSRSWMPLLPFFLFAAFGAALEVWMHIQGGSIGSDITTWDFVLQNVYPTMMPIFWKYIGLVAWPANLSGYYDANVYHSFLAAPVLTSLLAWLLAIFLVIRKGNDQVKFWFCWFWLCLLPVSNIVPIPVYYADRYMYTPAMALFALVIMTLNKIVAGKINCADRQAETEAERTATLGSAIIAHMLLAVIAGLFAVAAYDRMDVWKNEAVFWEDTARKSPGQYKARLNLGLVYEKHGRLAEAEREYLASVALYRNDEALAYLDRIRTKIRLNRELKLYTE